MRGSRSGHVQAGSNLWDKGNRELDRYGRNVLTNRGLQEWRPEKIRGEEHQKDKTEMEEYNGAESPKK